MTVDPPTAPDLRGLRVLEFCDYYGPANMGGSERVAREVNRRLAGFGARITVASAMSGPAFSDDGVQVLSRPAINLSRVVGSQLVVSRSYFKDSLATARLLCPDAVYTHSLHFHGSLVAAGVSRVLRVPLTTVVHVGGLDQLPPGSRCLAEAHERTIGRFVLGSSREVIAVSEAVAEHSRRRGAPADRITVARNGVDHERFRPTPPAVAVDGALTVLFVGRLIGNKGPQLLVDAARRVRNRGIRTRFVLAGDGPERDALEAATRRTGDQFVFLGRTDDVAGWLRRAHVAVRPSYTEGLPLAVLEAMASRRCVVASDIAAHRELIQHGANGLLHRAGDVEDLATNLARVLENAAVREQLADFGHRSSLACTWDAAAIGHAHAIARATDRLSPPVTAGFVRTAS